MGVRTGFLLPALIVILGTIAILAYDQWPVLQALHAIGSEAARQPVDLSDLILPPDTSSPLEVIAAVDRKIASGLTFVVIVAGLLPILIALLEVFRSRELRAFEEKAETRTADLKAEAKADRDWLKAELVRFEEKIERQTSEQDSRLGTMRTELRQDIEMKLQLANAEMTEELEKQTRTTRQTYLFEVTKQIESTVQSETARQIDLFTSRDTTAELLLIAFIRNDLPTATPAAQIEAVFLLQQAIRRLSGREERDVLMALTHLHGLVADVSQPTLGTMKQHLEKVWKQDLIRTPDNRQEYRDLIADIEALL